jgi:hypothetical protein
MWKGRGLFEPEIGTTITSEPGLGTIEHVRKSTRLFVVEASEQRITRSSKVNPSESVKIQSCNEEIFLNDMKS